MPIYNKYDGTDQSSVFKLINKFYYKCLICKVNMGHIKQSHFDLIEAVSNKSSILEINNYR